MHAGRAAAHACQHSCFDSLFFSPFLSPWRMAANTAITTDNDDWDPCFRRILCLLSPPAQWLAIGDAGPPALPRPPGLTLSKHGGRPWKEAAMTRIGGGGAGHGRATTPREERSARMREQPGAGAVFRGRKMAWRKGGGGEGARGGRRGRASDDGRGPWATTHLPFSCPQQRRSQSRHRTFIFVQTWQQQQRRTVQAAAPSASRSICAAR